MHEQFAKPKCDMNKVKILIAIAVLVAGIFGYYNLPELSNAVPQLDGVSSSPIAAFGVLIVGIIAACAIFATSESGKALIEFSKGSQIELRKMVWPTKQETMQTTMIVMIMVVLVALFLWLVDISVFEVIYDLMLGVDD